MATPEVTPVAIGGSPVDVTQAQGGECSGGLESLGGRFWSRSPGSSDGEEEEAPASCGTSSFRYLCRSPVAQADRDLSSGKQRKVVRSQGRRWAASVLLPSSPSVSLSSSAVGSGKKGVPAIKIPVMPPSVVSSSEMAGEGEWTVVRHKRRTVRFGRRRPERSSAQAPVRLPRPPFLVDHVNHGKNSNFRTMQYGSGHKAHWPRKEDKGFMARNYQRARQNLKGTRPPRVFHDSFLGLRPSPSPGSLAAAARSYAVVVMAGRGFQGGQHGGGGVGDGSMD